MLPKLQHEAQCEYFICKHIKSVVDSDHDILIEFHFCFATTTATVALYITGTKGGSAPDHRSCLLVEAAAAAANKLSILEIEKP